MTVTPVLYLSNGVKYKLPDVNLEPSGTAVVDLNAALESLGIASYATLSGYVEVDYSWPWDPLCATLRNLDTSHSLIFHYPLRSTKLVQLPDQPAPTAGRRTNVVEGMWWKQESNVTGFVSIANVAAGSRSAEVELTDDHGTSIAHHSLTISPHAMKTIQLQELSDAGTSSGGIRVTYVGTTNDLIINGGLEDRDAGYSAVLPFSPAPAASKISHATLAEVGLMAGAADPMMQFPAETTFTPYTVLRNVSSATVTATPTVWWMSAGKAQSTRLSSITLDPLQSRTLNLPAMMAAAGLKTFNGNLNVVFDRQGQTGALLMAAGSVDQTNTYVFEVIPHAVKESESKSLSYWSTGNGDDTMVTLWNPADEQQDLIFKLTFAGGYYLYPIHLEPRATRTFNISDLIENQVPDAEGNTIPGSVHEGAAKLMGSRADNEIILVSMSAGTYNVRKATCNIVCHGCDGATSWNMVDTPSSTTIGGKKQQQLRATWDTGVTYDESTWSSWTTANSAVATVETNVKGQTAGLVHGIQTGVTYVSATDASLTGPDYTSNWCEQSDWSCPLNFGGSGSAQQNVFKIDSVVPGSLVLGASGIMTITVENLPAGTPSVQFSGGGVTLGTPSVSTNGQTSTITLSYQVTCSALVGSYTLTVGNPSDGGSGASWGIAVILPAAPQATIKFNGNSVSGTQSVVVGQQIALSASVSLPSCTSLSQQQWTPTNSGTSGTPIGGYTTSTPASVTALPVSTNSSYTFYWAYPAASVNATYQYTMIGGGGSATSTAATANFKVTGPTGGTMTSSALSQLYIANLSACSTRSAGPYLIYSLGASGTACSFTVTTPGITFNSPTGYSNASGGTFFLGQLVNNDTLTGGGTTYGPGLDTSWPYASGTPFPHNDNPNIYLASTYTNLTRSFKANMFLMWQSTTSNSIPIPLGYQTWQFSATASCSGSCGSAGNWTVSSSSAGLVGNFIASSPSQTSAGQNVLQYGFPTWTSVSY